MNTLRQAAQQALEALVRASSYCDTYDAIGVLRQALEAEQQDEPVAWINWCAATGQRSLGWQCESELASEPLYTHPQPAQQPLTDEQIDAAVAPLYQNSAAQRMGRADDIATARAIERAHGIGVET